MDKNKHFLADRNKILIKRDHSNTIYFMSRYSDTENTVTRYIEGNELSYFLSKDLPLEDWNRLKQLNFAERFAFIKALKEGGDVCRLKQLNFAERFALEEWGKYEVESPPQAT